MQKKKGSLLEQLVKSFFGNIGFKATTNDVVNGFEVDVYAQVEGIRIVTQCKQYEVKEGDDTISDLILQWAGKRKYIESDHVILALWGFNITRHHYELAQREGVLLWDNDDIKSLVESSVRDPKNARTKLLLELGIDDDKTREYSAERATRLEQYFKTIFQRFSELYEEQTGYDNTEETKAKILHLEDISPEADDQTKCVFEYRRMHNLMIAELESCFKNGILMDEQKYGIMYSTFCNEKKYSFLRTIERYEDSGDYYFEVFEGFTESFSWKDDARMRKQKPNMDPEELDKNPYVILGSDGLIFRERREKDVEDMRDTFMSHGVESTNPPTD